MSRLVTAYLDGEADAGTAARVRDHLELCWGCSEDAEFSRLIKQALRSRTDRSPELVAVRLRRWVETELSRRA